MTIGLDDDDCEATSWETLDGVHHMMNLDESPEWSPSSWVATCETSLSDAVPCLEEPVDCLACLAAEQPCST